jgi:hypothetical protein
MKNIIVGTAGHIDHGKKWDSLLKGRKVDDLVIVSQAKAETVQPSSPANEVVHASEAA